MTQRAAVSQLESDFADAMNRLYAVGNGLARLRSELDRADAVGAPRGPVRSTPPLAAPATAPQPRSAPVSVPPPPPSPVAPTVHWYRREGAVTAVLAVAGALITMAGVAMLLVLAAQHGWFGPVARVTAGGVLAGLLVALGVRGAEADRRTDRGVVGSAPVALVATGAAAAYLDVVAVTSGYLWVSPALGLTLAGAVALGGLHLARRWGSELLAVLLVLGAAALAPFVAQGGGWVVSAFLGVLCVAGWWAGGSQTRPALTVVRVVPVTFSLLAGAVTEASNGAGPVGHVAVAAVVLAVTLVTSTLSVRRDAHDVSASVAVSMLSVGLLATSATLTDPWRTVTLAAAAAVLLLTATSLGRPPLGPIAGHLVATTGASGTVFAVFAVVSGAPDRFVTTGLLLLAVAGLAAAGVSRSRTTLALAAGCTFVAVLSWAPHPVATVTASGAGAHDMAVALLDSLLVAAVVATGLWAVASQSGLGRDVRLATTVVAWVLGLAASTTVSVAIGTLLGAEVGEPVLGFTIGHAVATVTWMLAAAWLLLRGLEHSRDADLTLRTGLVLAGISVAKLFLFDLAALNGLVRSVAFIVMGLLLLATGSRYAKAYERRRIMA